MAVQKGQHMVAHAPTGLGKTAAALAPAIAEAIATDRTVLYLTSRQSQHRIAVDTARLMAESRGAKLAVVDLVSKRDMCLRPEADGMTSGQFTGFCSRETRAQTCQYLRDVDEDSLGHVSRDVLHVEELMQVGRDHQLCPHLLAMTAGPTAHLVVADYNHLFSDLREQSLKRLGRAPAELIVVVDEAHNLPDRIRQNHSHRLTPYLLDMVASEARSAKSSGVQADVEALREALKALAAGAGATVQLDGTQARLVPVDALPEAFASARGRGLWGRRSWADALQDLSKLVTALRKGDAQIHAEELQEAMEDWSRFGDGGLRYLKWSEGGDPELHIRLLDPALVAAPVFEQLRSVLLVSGTLRPPEMVRDVLGLSGSRTLVKEYASPFPPENRLVVIHAGLTTRFQERGEALWAEVARTVDGVCAAARGNVAFFAPSYDILSEVLVRCQTDKERIVEDRAWGKSERDGVLDRLAAAKQDNGAILAGVMGGSLAEGIDYRDNLLSAVIVVGLPLAPPDLESDAVVRHLDKRTGKGRLYGYEAPAMNKVLQAMGRGIRSASDTCAMLLLDARFAQQPFRRLIPEDPAPIVATDVVTPVAAFLAHHDL